MADRFLLVEGLADKNFFESLCKSLKLHSLVTVTPPKEVGGDFNSKEGVFNHLPVLLSQLDDESITRLAIIVDADSKDNGGGYSNTIDKVTEIVKPYGFTLVSSPVPGILFQHDDGLADFGLWIMPNNKDEGMLEDWIKECVHTDESALFSHAETVVNQLPVKKFKEIHRSKAEVATWIAWQKKPGHGLYVAVEDKLIDTNNELFKDLVAWLNHMYKPEE